MGNEGFGPPLGKRFTKSRSLECARTLRYLPQVCSSEPSSQSLSPSQRHVSGMQCPSPRHRNWLIRHFWGIWLSATETKLTMLVKVTRGKKLEFIEWAGFM
ncbi:hypothetical protein AVEN_178298-1 [Araneus ventricosus]|uniref:Uncharacterized protein n=1 Tax=Araneus ventricosus TaxID=182803 RepID=A0A4Y2V5P9_ARAVE|nr:hypothetical protein AVEN_178298-1 [Araneus ventricosus]